MIGILEVKDGVKTYEALTPPSIIYLSVPSFPSSLFPSSPLPLPTISLGVGLPAERRAFWLSGLHHRVLHQEGGDHARIRTAADRPAGGGGEGQPVLQQQQRSGPEQPCCPEKERSGWVS